MIVDMHLFTIALGAILPLFGLVLIGYIGKKARVLFATDAQVLSRFVVEVALPAFIVDAFLTHHVTLNYFKMPLTLWAASVVAFGVVMAVGRVTKADPKTVGAMVLVSCFGNTGYLGYPITTALPTLLPNMLPATVLCDQLGMALLMYPSAVILGSMYGRAEQASIPQAIVRFLRSPIFVSLAIAIGLKFCPPIHPPVSDLPLMRAYHVGAALGHGLLAVIHTIALATVPVILIAIGLLLRPSTLKEHWREVTVVGVLKLVVSPIIGWALAKYALGLSGPLLAVCVLETATPPSASATVFAGQYEMDGSMAVASFFALTIASAVTIPLALGLLR